MSLSDKAPAFEGEKIQATQYIEHAEQQELIRYCRLQEGRYPELRLLFHVPNGGVRHKAVAQRLSEIGVRAGVPDLLLLVPRAHWHGLAIEMKAPAGRLLETQRQWLTALSVEGYQTAVCISWQQAWRVIEDYLGREHNG